MNPAPRAIELLSMTSDVIRDLADPGAFERQYGVSLGGEGARALDVTKQHEAHRQKSGAPLRWGGFLAIDRAAGLVVGTCGFTGAPNEGVVEIAYFTFPPYERRGYATAMAAALVAAAREESEVLVVRAHTLCESNASTKILTRLGFTHKGDAIDPDEGTVWRWELALVGS